MRPATVAAGLLACAAVAMAAAALTSGDDGEDEPRRAAVASATPEPAAARNGREVWVVNGCGSCHAFAAAGAEGQVAPNLSATLKGMPASYIRESIVNPNATAAAGYSTGMMPEDYSERIPPAQLEQLVEFIRAGVRD